ncbi:MULTISPECIES: STAS domain-containing protein [Rhizobium]|uniref:Chemotaxis protein CheX n=1 Tax=Rhizobium leucaenae TaxID=29450 RepID=A0A7W6ZRS6_9HYPH|nr:MULTISPECIES: STAS domain-containing protein [Rhizobium]AVA20299.1 sulfate transporter/antisigma-factor antagonist STAS domain-containing protein [Rhizobium sp. NXC24]MBB4567350.1 chemotaxis protein CheX [Rhizobium leucaenae]MBB6303098.1 chemotaxis protein CheX [Rhizobium leucaenae]MDK4740580.1 STAS domain-containing protein [Rhizobium sp. CNPSo 3464]UWU21591.1 STAS domain-containing protein [Rhizobium tropici]
MPSRKGEKTISLAAVLDLNEASTLRGKLVGLRGSNVVIDASGVERIGALCVQVIMAAAKTWDEDKLSFTFSKVSDAFQKTMQLIGVDIDHLLAKEIRQ